MLSSDDSSDYNFSDNLSLNSSDSSPASSPSKSRIRPPSFIGVEPSTLVGKVLTSVRKSPIHPSLTLEFADHTAFQLLVDGYNPHPAFRGVPKALEMNAASDWIFDPPGGHLSTNLTIRDCAFVILSDRAFDSKQKGVTWDEIHRGIAFKFSGEQGWHCVWATRAEHDEEYGECVFRSYNDVYLRPARRPIRIAGWSQKNKNGHRKWR